MVRQIQCAMICFVATTVGVGRRGYASAHTRGLQAPRLGNLATFRAGFVRLGDQAVIQPPAGI